MSDFIVALGLVFVIEGVVFAAFPGRAKRAVSAVLETPESALRTVGLFSAVIGLIVVWLVRGQRAGPRKSGSATGAPRELAFPPQPVPNGPWLGHEPLLRRRQDGRTVSVEYFSSRRAKAHDWVLD